jgi:hypothetical protein
MKTLTQWLRGLGATVALTVGAAAQVAPVAGEAPGNPAAAAELERFQVATQLRTRQPDLTPEQEEKLASAFLEHLRSRSPLAAEKLRGGRMEIDELNARLGVYLRDNPALLAGETARAVEDPRSRVMALLAAETALAPTERERQALAEQFLQRLGETNRVAREALDAGTLSPEELRTRLASFLDGLRAAARAAQTDPVAATLPAIIDSYLNDQLGKPQDRLQSLAFRGTVEDSGRTLDFVVFKKRPGLLRMHVIEGGVVVRILAYDGQTAWTQGLGEPAVRAIGSLEAEIMEMARFDPPLAGYRERGATVTREDRPGGETIDLRVREPDGADVRVSLDARTLTELTQQQTSPLGERIETRFRDHRKVGPLNVPYVQERWVNGKLRATNRITEVTPEPGLIDAFFARPGTGDLTYMNYQAVLRQALEQQKRAEAAKGGGK